LQIQNINLDEHIAYKIEAICSDRMHLELNILNSHCLFGMANLKKTSI